jgi:hypothetical protein
MNCQFCDKEFKNAGGLGAHEPYCESNPNKVKRKRSLNAGAKKGVKTWNKGKEFTEENIQRSVEFFEQGRHNDCVETVARRHAKRLLIHQKGNVCDVCGTSEWMGQPVPLVCDHINGDSTDNRFENFRNVCCNCDAQLPTYKSKNRGRGRKYDRERYQGGASR